MTDGPPHDDPRSSHILRVHRRAGAAGTVVQVAGELDLVTAPDLVSELTTARADARPPGPLVIDLTEVTFMADRAGGSPTAAKPVITWTTLWLLVPLAAPHIAWLAVCGGA
jgi:hypothetical protein